MDYSGIIKRAWKLVWKHKILWLFALFASSLTAGLHYNFNFGGNSTHYIFRGDDFPQHIPPFFRQSVNEFFYRLSEIHPLAWLWIMLSIIALVFLLSLISLFVSTAGRGGLIKGLLIADGRYTDNRLTFKEVWRAMKPYYWRLLFLRVLIGIGGMILSFILIIAFIISAVLTLGLSLCLIIPLAILAIPIGWLISAFVGMSSVALIDEDLDIFKALDRSWEVVTKNIWPTLATMFFISLISFLTAILVLLPLFLGSLPLAIAIFRLVEPTAALWVIGAILFLLAFILAIFIGMWANTLVHGIFVLTWRRLKFLNNIENLQPSSDPQPVQQADDEIITNVTSEENSGNIPASPDTDEVPPEA